MQVIKDWLHKAVEALHEATALHPTYKLAAAIVFMCCAYRVCISLPNYASRIPDKINVVLLKMLSLQPSGEDYEFLKSIMIENESR